jgi:hypothetical protein
MQEVDRAGDNSNQKKRENRSKFTYRLRQACSNPPVDGATA